MPTINIDLDTDSFHRLAELAVEERRPIPWQAEVVLRRALGLPFPIPHAGEQRTNAAEHVRKEHTHA